MKNLKWLKMGWLTTVFDKIRSYRPALLASNEPEVFEEPEDEVESMSVGQRFIIRGRRLGRAHSKPKTPSPLRDLI